MSKLKHKEKILKAEREMQLVTYKGAPMRETISWILKRNFVGQKALAQNVQSDKRQGIPMSETKFMSLLFFVSQLWWVHCEVRLHHSWGAPSSRILLKETTGKVAQHLPQRETLSLLSQTANKSVFCSGEVHRRYRSGLFAVQTFI